MLSTHFYSKYESRTFASFSKMLHGSTAFFLLRMYVFLLSLFYSLAGADQTGTAHN